MIIMTTINKHNSILPIIVGIIIIIMVTASIAANAAATTNTTTTITITNPCLSGDINDYCLGYHHGASAADKDRSNDNSTVSFNQYRCNDGNSQYCAGFARGYIDETAELQ
jgi:hypothetical protein